MSWLPVALLCAFSLATADALSKRWLAGWGHRELILVRFGATGLLLLPLLFMQPLPELRLEFWLWLAFLIPLEILAMALYVVAIRDAPLSHTLPYLAFTPVLTGLFGFLVLGETLSPVGLFGMLLVVAGAWWLNLDHALAGERFDPFAPLRAIGKERGARLMLGVAMIYGIASVGGKAAMAGIPPVTFGAIYFVAVAAATFVIYALPAPRRIATLATRPAAVFAVAAAMAVMAITHFIAVSQVEAAYMITVKRTSLLFGMLYGAWWLGEKDLPRNLAAGGLMVLGVGLVLAQP